jgi:CBS domain-containing protein
MNADVISVHAEDDVHSLLRLIAERRHNHLPVVDPEGKLVGVLTRVDVLESLAADS